MARPATLPTVDAGHAFAANLTHAWTFHATANRGGADADDIVGGNDATLQASAALSDTLGLDMPAQTDYATITEISFAPTATAFSIMFRAKLDTLNTESMVCGRTADGSNFIWAYNGSAIQMRFGAQDLSLGTSGGTTL